MPSGRKVQLRCRHSCLLDSCVVTGSRHAAAAPVALVPTSGDLASLELLAKRRLRSRGLASPRLDHHVSRTLDPRPRLIDPASWRALEAAVDQRVRLLDTVAEDLYGDQRTVRSGIVAADAVFANPAFALAAVGWSPAAGRRLALAAFDFRHDPQRGWVLVRDRLTAPTELGRTLENREIVTQLLPADQHRQRVRRLGHFQAALRRALSALAPPGTEAPRVLLLSPGREDHGHSELAELARVLGYTVAEAADLTVRHGALFLSSLSGLEPVHVLGRFVEDRGADPLELPGDGSTGIAGLLAAARRGTVTVANALGIGLLETAAMGAWWPRLCRHLLGEDLLSEGDELWWGGAEHGVGPLLDGLGSLELLPLDPQAEPIDTRQADAAALEALRRRLVAEPWRWTARRPLEAGTAMVRAFAVFDGTEVTVMPGGFATEVGRAGVSADVWVPQSEGSRFVDLPVRVAGLGQVDFADSLPSQAGEAMFFLGRHLERAEAIVRLTRTVLDRAEQESLSDMPAWLADLTEAVDRLTGNTYSGAMTVEVVDAALRDPDRWEGLPSTVSQLLACAGSARELLSVEVWDGLGRLREAMTELSGRELHADIGWVRDQLDRMLGDLASVAGVVHESMVYGPGWHLLDAGRRIERAHQLVSLLDTLLHSRPGQVEDEILEALLTTGVSLVAYRRRHRSDLELDAVLAILVLDPSNPRSVRHCLARLVTDLAELPSPQRPGGREATYDRAKALHDFVAGLSAVSLANRFPSERPGEALPRTLHTIAEGVTAVSEALQDVYLRHVTMARLPRDAAAARRLADGAGPAQEPPQGAWP